MRFQLKKVEPTGVREGLAFVHRSGGGGCGPEVITSDTYPESPGGDLLREARKAAPVFTSLGDGARRLGLRAEQLSGLEHGRYTFADPVDFETAAKILKGDWPKRADGWPICPVCNEDELGCLDADESIAGNMAAYLKRELFCHRCTRRYPGGTFTSAEVAT